MDKILKWEDFKINPMLDTVKRIKMSDEEYFSSKYAQYISNSRLKGINPDQDGSPEIYKNGLQQDSSQSLNIGSAVHQLYLQPELFKLGDNHKKPSAKLGNFVDKVKKHRKLGLSIYDALMESSKDANYYYNKLSIKKIKDAIAKGFHYYWNSKDVDESNILLHEKDLNICSNCLNSLHSNMQAHNLINCVNSFDVPETSYNEDAFFIDVEVTYKDKSITLPLKMKADNWTINFTDEIITLNDLKTTSKSTKYFMHDEYGSFKTYHYARQMAFYSWILKQYCIKQYKVDWEINKNMIVVETLDPFNTDVFTVSDQHIDNGTEEFMQLLKRIAYCEMFGYNDNENVIWN